MRKRSPARVDATALGVTQLELMVDRADLSVWLARLDLDASAPSRAVALLAPDEEERAGRFRFAEDRDAFVVRRALLRLLLATVLDVPPERVRFGEAPAGKPVLASPDAPLGFSLSRSGDAVAVAVAAGIDVGVDVERLDGVQEQELEGLAAVALGGGEAAELAALPPGERLRAFLEWWTAKEALLKADGTGLSLAPPEIVVERRPDLRVSRAHPSLGGPWRLERLDLPDDLVGALASRAPVSERA